MEKEQKGIPLYIFGIQAIEAAALGKIVCTRFPFFDKYEKEFGKCGLINTETPEILSEKLEFLLSLNHDEFVKLQKKSREWVVRCHSYKVIGERFVNIFEDIRRKKYVQTVT
jgi:glycosyltransferase involved in cell wall biosynthesis